MNKEKIEQKAKEISENNYSIIDDWEKCKRSAIDMADWILNNLWTSVEEELPELYRNVFVIFDNLHTANAYYDGEYWWWNDGFPIDVDSYGNAIYSSQQRCEDKPTHWMYIPEIKGGKK